MRWPNRLRSTSVNAASSQMSSHPSRIDAHLPGDDVVRRILAELEIQGAASRQVASVLVRLSPTISIAWLATLPERLCGQMS